MTDEMKVAFEMAEREYNLARTAYFRAVENFDNAGAEYIDLACHDIAIAESRMDNALRRLKQLQQERDRTEVGA